MAATVLTVTPLKQNNYAVVAADLAISFVASDNVNGNQFPFTGKEILLVQNADGAAPHGFTITSVGDTLGRLDTTLTNYSVPLSAFAAIQLSQVPGWSNGGNLFLTSSSAQLKFSVLRTA